MNAELEVGRFVETEPEWPKWYLYRFEPIVEVMRVDGPDGYGEFVNNRHSSHRQWLVATCGRCALEGNDEWVEITYAEAVRRIPEIEALEAERVGYGR